MEGNKNTATEMPKKSEFSSFDIQALLTSILLNWKWVIFSIIVCLGLATAYLRYKTPIYQASAKLLIKEQDGRGRQGSSLLRSSTLGMMSNSAGIENEMEILSSRSLAEEVVRDLKLYTYYQSVGKIKDIVVYGNQPVNVDLDPEHLEILKSPINLLLQREGNAYHVTGSYYSTQDGKTYSLNKRLKTLPATIGTRVGMLYFTENADAQMFVGQIIKVTITSPKSMSYRYRGALSVSPPTRGTSIVRLSVSDESPQKAADYLKQLAVVYNRQGNEDKNEIARRTEEFINRRLEKINTELGSTEDKLESYKKSNKLTHLSMNASQAMSNSDEFEKKLNEANTQLALMNSVQQSVNSGEKYQVLPTNVGIQDNSVNSLISQYNTIALERNRLLRSASENSPAVTPLTSQLDELSGSINRAMNQAKQGLSIQRNAVASQYNKYAGQIQQTPEQEHTLTQIGRQQEVKSGLYLMLLQKREENSISLAATADKGKLIDTPERGGKISPNSSSVMLTAAGIGAAIPILIIFLIQLFRYKIEGHEDVVKLTDLPILADVAIASETAKTKADIVVHENQNNQMEETFRSMRTNLQFLLKEGQKVILFTSTTSGEGKTFNAANLAVSFALLSKKVILVGLDIRKPRLAELFEINDHHHGLTPLLAKDDPTWEEIQHHILPSGINNHLDVLMSGPIPPNPSELVARPSLDKVILSLKQHYDYVLIDSAPVGLVTDTLQIGRLADATIYMCRADYTPKESFNFINSLANEEKLPHMSIVLNGIDMSKKKYGYYYGYGRYGKYGHYGQYKSYGSYGSYGTYGNNSYGDKNDTSVKR